MSTSIAGSYGPPPNASNGPSAPSDRAATNGPRGAVGQPASQPDRRLGPIAATPPRPAQPPTAGQSRTKQALAKLHDFSNNLRQRAADRIQPRTTGAGHPRRQAPVGYATRYPTGGAGTGQPYAQNYGAMTQNPSRTAGYLKAGLKWGALATMPIALSLLGVSSMGGVGGSILYPYLAYGAMNSFMIGAATGMAAHRRRAMQAQWLGAMQAQQQGMPAPSQANPYQRQPGMPQQPQAYPQQASMYARPNGYPQQPGMYAQPNAYPQQPGTYAQPHAYPQQPGMHAQRNAYPQQPGMYAQPNAYRQQPSVPQQANPYRPQPSVPQQANPYRQQPGVSQQAPSPASGDVRVLPLAAQAVHGDSSSKTGMAETLRALPPEQRNSRFDSLLASYQNLQPPQSESDSDRRPPSLLGLAQLIPAMYGKENERAAYSADNDPALRAYRKIHAERGNLPQRSPVLDQALSAAFASLTPAAQLRFEQDNAHAFQRQS